MRRPLLATTCALALAAGAGRAQAAAYAFSPVSDPNAPSFGYTAVTGINDAGQVVGNFFGGSSAVSTGFLDTGGVFTSIVAPAGGATGAGTTVGGINNKGQVTGFSFNGSFVSFVDTNGSFATLPGAAIPPQYPVSNGFFASGLNNAGTVTGSSVLLSGSVRNQTQTLAALVDAGGVFSTINGFTAGAIVPGNFPGNTAINDAGAIVGADGSVGFLDIAGVTTPISVPGASSTAATGISDSGLISGTYVNATGSHGFVDDNGVFTTIDAPGATGGTALAGINSAGDVVGTYTDATGRHSFLATPVAAVPEPASITLLGAGVAALGAIRRRSARARPNRA